MATKRKCQWCGEKFEAIRPDAIYCRPGHRNAAYRARRKAAQAAEIKSKKSTTSQTSSKRGGSSTYSALRDHLAALEQNGKPMAQALLVVAKRIDRIDTDPTEETGASLSSLVLRLGVELQRMEAKSTGSAGVEDEVAKARERRDSRRNAR